jgi:hypothetical protein
METPVHSSDSSFVSDSRCNRDAVADPRRFARSHPSSLRNLVFRALQAPAMSRFSHRYHRSGYRREVNRWRGSRRPPRTRCAWRARRVRARAIASPRSRPRQDPDGCASNATLILTRPPTSSVSFQTGRSPTPRPRRNYCRSCQSHQLTPTMVRLLLVLVGVLRSTCRSRADLVLENAARRHQLACSCAPPADRRRRPRIAGSGFSCVDSGRGGPRQALDEIGVGEIAQLRAALAANPELGEKYINNILAVLSKASLRSGLRGDREGAQGRASRISSACAYS